MLSYLNHFLLHHYLHFIVRCFITKGRTAKEPIIYVSPLDKHDRLTEYTVGGIIPSDWPRDCQSRATRGLALGLLFVLFLLRTVSVEI